MIDYSLHPVLIEVLWILNIQFSKEACPPYYFMYKNGCIMYIYLNPQYVIRNENNCSYIIAKSALITAKLEHAMAFASVVPPSIGYILSHIGEGELNASIENIANTLNIKPDLRDKFIRKIIGNPVKVGWNYKGVTISFSPYLLISVKEESEGSVYTDNELFYTTDFIPKRPSVPLNLNFMITTQCRTDCMYYYADRNRKNDLTSWQIIKVIDEAHDMGGESGFDRR